MYKENLAIIRAQNAKKNSFDFEENEYADWTSQEFAARNTLQMPIENENSVGQANSI